MQHLSPVPMRRDIGADRNNRNKGKTFSTKTRSVAKVRSDFVKKLFQIFCRERNSDFSLNWTLGIPGKAWKCGLETRDLTTEAFPPTFSENLPGFLVKMTQFGNWSQVWRVSHPRTSFRLDTFCGFWPKPIWLVFFSEFNRNGSPVIAPCILKHIKWFDINVIVLKSLEGHCKEFLKQVQLFNIRCRAHWKIQICEGQHVISWFQTVSIWVAELLTGALLSLRREQSSYSARSRPGQPEVRYEIGTSLCLV